MSGSIAESKPSGKTGEVKGIACPWPDCAWADVQDGVVTKCALRDRYHIGCPISGGRAR